MALVYFTCTNRGHQARIADECLATVLYAVHTSIEHTIAANTKTCITHRNVNVHITHAVYAKRCCSDRDATSRTTSNTVLVSVFIL